MKVFVLIREVGLNPCFNGRYSQRWKQLLCNEWELSLNPCFNGRYSQSVKNFDKAAIARS